MKLLSQRGRAPLVLLALLLGACTESSPVDPGLTSEPWQEQFLFGNTFINTGPVTTNQDGVSHNILSDYVTAAALPNTDLQSFITHVYLPTDAGVSTRVSGVSIRAAWTDGSRTGNIYRSSGFIQQSTLQGQTYDVHRLEGLYLGTPTLRPSNFANVNFVFTVEYLSPSGAVLHSSQKTVEIYKR